MPRWVASTDHQRTACTALVNQAPPWPPVLNVAAYQPRAPQPPTVSPGANEADRSFEDDEWSDTSSELYEYEKNHRYVDTCEEQSWSTEWTTLPDEFDYDDDESDEEDEPKGSGGELPECATGFFIGRDGTAWPMPPPECMPGASPSPYQQDIASDRSRESSRESAHPGLKEATHTGPNRGRDTRPKPLMRRWANTTHSVSRSAQKPIGKPPSPDAVGTEVGMVRSPESSSPTSPSPPGSLAPTLSDSVSPPSYSPIPSTPPDESSYPSLADLGRQWYASFGKALGAQFGIGGAYPQCPPQRAPRAIEPQGLSESSSLSYSSMGGFNSETHVVGRHGLVWPRPPPPPSQRYSWG
ncbi:hypothetical protein C8Q79DRAFT_667765 [Trametes meyenii]|nr:hypothetical protein C8Q79DRAFT_667765 [Trametes meyenii]